ncbi:MAG: AEC family transporter, partial [Oscillospiraceae bacterium]|nr:AEC family transporter [Oscillospiraceae bacterium]
LLLLSASIVISRKLLRRPAIDHYAASLCNTGFMGIPLVAASVGQEYVIYTAAIAAMTSILQWGYGQYVLSPAGEKPKLDAKGIILNPFVLSLLIGFALYFLPIKLPSVLTDTISSLQACTAPVAMMILGVYLTEVPLKKLFSTKRAYVVTFVRLIVIPVISALLLRLIPGISFEVKCALLICASAPVGCNTAIFADRFGQDYGRTVTMVCLSTVLSIITMPLIVAFFNLIR